MLALSDCRWKESSYEQYTLYSINNCNYITIGLLSIKGTFMGDSQALNMYVRKVEGCYWKKLAEIQMLPQKPNCDCFGWQQIGVVAKSLHRRHQLVCYHSQTVC